MANEEVKKTYPVKVAFTYGTEKLSKGDTVDMHPKTAERLIKIGFLGKAKA